MQLLWYSENERRNRLDDKLFETLTMLKVDQHYW